MYTPACDDIRPIEPITVYRNGEKSSFVPIPPVIERDGVTYKIESVDMARCNRMCTTGRRMTVLFFVVISKTYCVQLVTQTTLSNAIKSGCSLCQLACSSGVKIIMSSIHVASLLSAWYFI